MNEQLAFWINLLAPSTAIVGLFFVAYELYRARQAEIRQFHFDTFKLYSIDLKPDSVLESKLHLHSGEELAKKLIGDLETAHAFKNILDFYTLLASAAHDKTVNRDKAFEYWGQPVISFWTTYSPLLIKRRELLGVHAFGELERFVNESDKAHPEFSSIVETMGEADRKAWRGE